MLENAVQRCHQFVPGISPEIIAANGHEHGSGLAAIHLPLWDPLWRIEFVAADIAAGP
jgi:hypothetical protein